MAKNIKWWPEDYMEVTATSCNQYHFKKKGLTGSDALLIACKGKGVFVKVAAYLLTLNMF